MTSNKQVVLQPSQSGFTLVEIMVGLVIGMIATLVVMQVFSVFEAQKRTTTGSMDAQTNGNIALYRIKQDLLMGGYALNVAADSALECATLAFGGTGITSIDPVTITDGGAAGSDTITIRYGDQNVGGVPTRIEQDMAGLVATVGSTIGCNDGDIALVVKGTNCALTKVKKVSTVAPWTVEFADVTAVTAKAAVKFANVSCMGGWNTITYAVNNKNLERNGEPFMTGIVNIQAQYGVSTLATDNQITSWVDAKDGQPSGNWGVSMTVDERNRIKAVRIAIVARNEKKELQDVAKTCSSVSAAQPTGLCAWDATSLNPANPTDAPTIDLSADQDWKRYHYKVFETVIPLRNVIWARATL